MNLCICIFKRNKDIICKEITICCESMIHLYSNSINKYNLKSNTLMHCVYGVKSDLKGHKYKGESILIHSSKSIPKIIA